MTLKKFFAENPQIAPLVHLDDDQIEILSKIDLGRLSNAIKKSGFLKSRKSFNWLIRNYDNILAGAYGDWSRYVAPERRKRNKKHNATDRRYSKKELAALVTTVEDADF